MFLENRVYQGSSGKVYPLPFIDRISRGKTDRSYQAIFIENEYLQVMILPELGGRIHAAYDKIAGYDFVYRQHVIKPALVGLAGPWISGGIEFNWPQHHRPSTFMPCEFFIEESEDGSKTVWLSEHEPMNRMKGMHGVCLRPGSSAIELKVRLYNRTPFTQSFLWWANVANRVHERYQSFFPPDVGHIGDHAKRAVETFPAITSRYYGVDYGRRASEGVPAEEQPRCFKPDGSYAANRIDWYANIPVPTSYMVLRSRYNFFGGYDHAARAGFVHIANRHISPGKKQWTWGNQEFGYAWDRNLTDEDGPYVELMAGVYTDNQPDFSWLAPYETKTFRQYWYSIREIGPAKNATIDAALSVSVSGQAADVGICPSKAIPGAEVLVNDDSRLVLQTTADLDPRSPLKLRVPVAGNDVSVRVLDSHGKEVVAFEPVMRTDDPSPLPASEPRLPEEVASSEELYRIGVHLDQYRHATRKPETYWSEAVRRFPDDVRSLTALGNRHLLRGEFGPAEELLKRATAVLTRWNPNPPDGEAFYLLGLAFRYQDRLDEAYEALYKSTWNSAWKSPGLYAVAQIDCRRSDWLLALEHLRGCLVGGGDHNGGHCLRATILRHMGDGRYAMDAARTVIAYDPLDHWALREAGLSERFQSAMRADPQNFLDLAIDYGSAGFYEDALAVLRESPVHPMVSYAGAYYATLLGDVTASARWKNAARALAADCIFPHRLEEIKFLKAYTEDPADAKAPFYLGNLLYDRRSYEDAVSSWETAVARDASNSVAWRNLGIAYHNVRGDREKAADAYERALTADPHDARVLYERDQLWKRMGIGPEARLSELERHPTLVKSRDDLTLELCGLYCLTGDPARAKEIFQNRQFAPWEGGEGLALGLFSRTCLLLARGVLADGDPQHAIQLLQEALDPPPSLGEARHLLANPSDIWLLIGDAFSAAGQRIEAEDFWRRAADFKGDFQEMSVRSYSEMTTFRAIALRRLGRPREAEQLLRSLRTYAVELEASPAKVDYFATSLPAMLLFTEDIQRRQTTTARFLRAQAEAGLGDLEQARRLLDEVLECDPSHAMAIDLRQEIAGRPNGNLHS